MSERCLLRFVGGILDGQTMYGQGWPPPEVLDPITYVTGTWPVAARGAYRKVRQSQLPEPVPGMLRGAQYEWVEEMYL